MRAVLGAALAFTWAAGACGSTETTERPTEGFGCVDAAPAGTVVADDAGALLADSAGASWVVDAELHAREVDVGATDLSHGVTGGDGRIWFVTEDARVVAVEPAVDAATLGPPVDPNPWTGPALIPTPDGAGVLRGDQLVSLSGSPIDQQVLPLDGLPPESRLLNATSGPDGRIWVVTDGAITSFDAGGRLKTSVVVDTASFADLFAGTACAVYVEGCPGRIVVIDDDGVDESTVGTGCGGVRSAIADGVVWIGGQEVVRVDLASGAISRTEAFDCGEGTRALAGPNGVAVLDDCDIAAVRLDPATGAVLDRRDFADEVADPGDVIAWGSWPWAGFEDIVLQLPSLEPVPLDIEMSPEAFAFGLVATLPPTASSP